MKGSSDGSFISVIVKLPSVEEPEESIAFTLSWNDVALFSKSKLVAVRRIPFVD